MTDARDEILTRVRSALAGGASAHGATVHISAGSGSNSVGVADALLASPQFSRDELIHSLSTELARVRGMFHVARDAASVCEVVAEIARTHQAKEIVGWAGDAIDSELSRSLTGQGLKLTLDDGDGDAFVRAAEQAQIGLTTVDYAVADTGTLVVLSGKGRARSASLLPPVHIAIVRPEQIVPGLSELFDDLSQKLADCPSAITLITGPSRTADIELKLVVGVHGPQELHVVLLNQ